jgi:predicted aspartyl protease
MDITLIIISPKGQIQVIVDGALELHTTTLQKDIYSAFGITQDRQKFPNINIALSAFENDLESKSIVIVEDDPICIGTGLIYIPLLINETYKARCILDTGASYNMISIDYVRAINCEHLIDKNYQGSCVGVGTANILGKIKHMNIKINNVAYRLTVDVSDTKECIFLLGIAFMRKNNCIINTMTNQVIFGTNKVEMLSDDDCHDVKVPITSIRDIGASFLTTKQSHSSPEEFARILKVIVANIKNHPNEDKYATIKKNEKVQNLLCGDSCTSEFIKELGFDIGADDLKFTGRIDAIDQLLSAF